MITPSANTPTPAPQSVDLAEIVRRFWGYGSLRPLQEKAMESVIAGRDSLVVLPTGGGKSLCYQAPALALDGMAIVISPLISLMKDQVDGLRAVGAGAACINSSLTVRERRETHELIQAGQVKLLYVAPERVVKPDFIEYLKQLKVSFVAIDEAHCISQWGHDFRPEYRALESLRGAFPEIAFHGYTATATPQVRADVCASLKLKNPEILVASADRPNLVYAAERRTDEVAQVLEVVERHKGESGVIYCITRKKVEELCMQLNAKGHAALPYHAGMDAATRQKNQEAFSREGAEIIVATVAFGMGIDKPDVRYVVHTGMPKTIEHYQQESGRAGRDGLEAECRLLYSGTDFSLWEYLLKDQDEASKKIARAKLNDMYNYCTGVTCRHRVLMAYFGEKIEKTHCGACDLCLGNADMVKDALVIAQKILSCVVRLGDVAGPSYTTLILTGSREARVLEKGHDKLSTWGLLQEHDAKNIRNWIEQLASQGYLRKAGEYSILEVTTKGRLLLRGEETPRLLKPAEGPRARSRESAASAKSWSGVDKALFEALRALRREIAQESGIPAFAIFGDAALRDMARRKPGNKREFLQVSGVGEKKCADYAARFLPVIQQYTGEKKSAAKTEKAAKPNKARDEAFALYKQGWGIAEVAEHLNRSSFQATMLLKEYIRANGITDPTEWVDPVVAEDIAYAVEEIGKRPMEDLFERLNREVDVELISVVIACLENEGVV
ncbi:MAG: DNA helicase RecQ [Candidatus Hydrogenedentes bacterium]|nr:DNA helicase RecQ [Candidatus Hydrogenedentota bacterium]